MWRTPSGPSTVTMFQVNATRSRQKQSSTNKPAAASRSLAVRALSKSASHIVAAFRGAEASTGRSAVVSVIVCTPSGGGWSFWVVGLTPPSILRSGPALKANCNTGGQERGFRNPRAPAFAGLRPSNFPPPPALADFELPRRVRPHKGPRRRRRAGWYWLRPALADAARGSGMAWSLNRPEFLGDFPVWFSRNG